MRFLIHHFRIIVIAGILILLTAFVPQFWGFVWKWYSAAWLTNTVVLLVVWFGFKIIAYWARYIYGITEAKNLVTLKVTLPRNDSKVDQEKRTEKDFKEKLAVMEQLYRALWEIRDLNIWQLIHYSIFQDITLSFELYLEDSQLTFYIVTDPKYAHIVEKQVTAFYPDAEVAPAQTPQLRIAKQKLSAYYLSTAKNYAYPIRFYEQMQDDPLNSIANVLSKLEDTEKACIQVILSPVLSDKYAKNSNKLASNLFKNKKKSLLGNIPILGTLLSIFDGILTGTEGKSFAPSSDSGDGYVRMLQPQEELYKRMGEKAGQSFYHTSIRIFGASKTWDRAIQITNNIQVAMNSFKDTYGNTFTNKRILFELFPMAWNAPLLEHLWRTRINGGLHKTCELVEKELAGLFHFPDSRYNTVPIIQWNTYKVLPPPPDSPEEGILLGKNDHRGETTDIKFLGKDRTRHHYIIGKSGSGKSALLSYMARQDVVADGMCLIDPHGDLVDDTLAYIPKERAKDVVVFDPSDIERPMGLNLLEANSPEEKDRASLDAMEIFIKLFGNEIFGPRIQHYFRNGCLTLMDDEEEGATLIDVPRLFVDDDFQKYKVSKCKNAVVKSFWDHEIANTGEREKQEMIPYFSSKFGPFITNTTMRNIIGQPKSAFNIRQIMDEGKILLVNLSKGKIGDSNAQLLGLIFVNKISMAAMGRADIRREDRRRFYLYDDEFQNFVTDAFATILSEARKYELALIMAHQYIGQLVEEGGSTKMRDAVFGNVGTIMSFKIGADDAEYMAKEFAPVLSEQDVIGIPNFNCYVKLNINNVQSRPFSMKTIWDESLKNVKLADLIKEYSRMKYGRKKVFVDQEIEERIGLVS